MWCLCCSKPSTSEEAETQEAAQIAGAIRESSLLRQQEEEEERRRSRVLEVDAQIANGFMHEERERQPNNVFALEDEDDEQLTKNMLESLKESGKGKHFEDEQMKKDEQFALIVQESLNMVEPPPQTKVNKSISCGALLDVDKQLDNAIMESLKEKGKAKQFEDEQVKKDEQFALIVQESLNMVESPPRLEENKDISAQLESLKGKGQAKQSSDEAEEDGKLPNVNPPHNICGGCNSMIEHGSRVNATASSSSSSTRTPTATATKKR